MFRISHALHLLLVHPFHILRFLQWVQQEILLNGPDGIEI